MGRSREESQSKVSFFTVIPPLYFFVVYLQYFLIDIIIALFTYLIRFKEHVQLVDQALRDNIDTKTACEEIRRLVSASNIYLNEQKDLSNPNLLHSIAAYITRLLDTFGCVSLGDPIGFPAHSASSASGGGEDREAQVMPFIDVISQLRQEIRKKATELKSGDLFKLCDSIRDDVLPNLGVRMEDYNAEDGQLLARVKLVEREILLREREEKIHLERLKQQEKEAKKVNAAAAKLVEPPMAPGELFRKEVGKYSQFADNGMPTHDQEGKELTKTALKKIVKLFEVQEKKYNAYLKSSQGASK